MTHFELVHKIYRDNLPTIEELISKSKYPKTFLALRNFHEKIFNIMESLEEIEKIKGFYASQCLSRILYEHFLVAYYIWTKCRVDKDDSCGSDYIDYYPIFEMMKRENYNSRLDKSYEKNKTPLQNFLVAVPEFDVTDDPMTEADVQDINKKANKFDIRNILYYMQNELDSNDAFKSLHEVVHDSCRKYNNLSTYVHGGRMAELQTFENIPATDKDRVIKDNTAMAKVYCAQLLSLTILLIMTENQEAYGIFKPIHDFINSRQR